MTTPNMKFVLSATVACWAAVMPLHAGLLMNPGFESGLTGWSRTDQVGSEGTFFLQTGALSPLTATPVQPPPAGSAAAMTDAEGPGSHALYQDFLVPMMIGSASVQFALYINNAAPDFYLSPHLDFASNDPLAENRINQRARVDLLRSGADPFSIAPADILMNLFETQPGDPLLSGYTEYSVNVTALLQAHAGQTLRLRFAEVDNVLNFNFGVDNADVDVSAIPEPATWMMMAAGVLSLVITRRCPRWRLKRVHHEKRGAFRLPFSVIWP